MADPCVEDTPYIGLDTTGSPAVLAATLLNPASSGSDTQGDDTTHVVTDSDVWHIQTQNVTLDNSAGTGAMGGILVAAINPLWVGESDGPISIIWEASLTVVGHADRSDQRDTITTPMDTGEIRTFSPGCLVGNVVVPAGGTQVVTWEVRVKNDGAGAQWSFRFGGSRLVWSKF